ncbi:MAG: class I SAM-dependent methyltransferase [Spirochaetes bacterium]|nr:class I SAM-dependent methyltransferase [Spirochaetota bacterium]
MYFAKRHGASIIKYLVSNVDVGNKSILDFGSGPGYILRHLISTGIPVKYHALDFSSKSIDSLRREFAGSIQDSIYTKSLPSKYASNSFDVILSIETVEHLNDDQLSSTADEFLRLLKPGGVLFITTQNEENLEASHLFCTNCGSVFHQWQHLRSWSADTIRSYFERKGFTTKKVDTVEFLIERSLKNVLKLKIKKAINHKLPSLVYIGRKGIVGRT